MLTLSNQDRPWNDPVPRRGREAESEDRRPTLKAIILDFSTVNNVDVTSVQQLIDVRNQLDRYASPDIVEWHFASINNRWTKRALASAGFGFPAPLHREGDLWRRWKPVFSVAELGGSDSAASYAEWQANNDIREQVVPVVTVGKDYEANAEGVQDSDRKGVSENAKEQGDKKKVAVHGVNRPLFHVDLTVALQSAIHNAEKRAGASATLIMEDVADLQEH